MRKVAAALLIVLLAATQHADAKVVRVEITSRTAVLNGRAFASCGPVGGEQADEPLNADDGSEQQQPRPGETHPVFRPFYHSLVDLVGGQEYHARAQDRLLSRGRQVIEA